MNVLREERKYGIDDAYIKNVKIGEEYEIIIVYMEAYMFYYLEGIDSKVVEQGSKNCMMAKKYEVEFEREAGIKTNKEEHKESLTCPNCNAIYNVDKNHNCKYCGKKIEHKDNLSKDWMLKDIRMI